MSKPRTNSISQKKGVGKAECSRDGELKAQRPNGCKGVSGNLGWLGKEFQGKKSVPGRVRGTSHLMITKTSHWEASEGLS